MTSSHVHSTGHSESGIAWLGRVPSTWEIKPLWSMFERTKEVGHPDQPMLSVFREYGVIPKDSRENLNVTAENRDIYQLVDRGWLIINRMKAWQGSVGVSSQRGIVSGHYICFRPLHDESPGYLNWLLRSSVYTDAYRLLSRGVRPGQAEIDNDYLRSLPILLPPILEQRRIADFLDDQVARINNIIAARTQQIANLDDLRLDLAWTALTGADSHGDREASGMSWLDDVPAAWPMATVHAAYSVMLGKMLDESRFTGLYPMPYLRNTNVQWDRIATDDLKVMDIEPGERDRYTVRKGDLLICEGGQPGRSAIWDGSIAEIGYQKALHRARPRGDNDVRWLQAFLRIAVGLSVFSVEFGQATIGHLTGEQLRGLRLPVPPPAVQKDRMHQLQAELRTVDQGQRTLRVSADRFEELKRALITAAVTGEFDVSSADGSRVPA